MKDYFLMLASYHRWAYGKLFDSLKPVGDREYRQDAGLPFGSIHGTLNHQLLADRLWLARFEHRPAPYARLDEELEPDRSRLASALDQEAQQWRQALMGWSEDRFSGDLSYITTEGAQRRLPVIPLLAHVFNHGTHHRGQVTAVITRLGFDYPILDLPYFLAEVHSR
ncbi:DinB family protein [mine drainage metagenome]|uniref:DinB family protein n=1 Tax=mine drainage metagenome TaxID=410659 RepID=T1A6H5_9ZZZZ